MLTSPVVQLTEDQERVADKVIEWFKGHQVKFSNHPLWFSVGGYAGTGKTTVISQLLNTGLADEAYVEVCAPTGKAAQVLRNKGIKGARTVHKLIYLFKGTVSEDKGYVVTHKPIFQAKEELEDRPDLVIVDESSMVNARMFRDLMVHEVPVLWVGDHGQLPPIGGDPGIMRKPTQCLEKIMRQALDSGIVRVAHRVRQGDNPSQLGSVGGADVRITRQVDPVRCIQWAIDTNCDQIIVAHNKVRVDLNREFRNQRWGVKSVHDIQPGDRLICLQNSYRYGVMNGQILWATKKVETRDQLTDIWQMTDELGVDYPEIPVYTPGLGQLSIDPEEVPSDVCLFDYGYAVTCHKAQGSEWDRVLVIEQWSKSWDMKRWRYTAYTRAKKHLTVALAI